MGENICKSGDQQGISVQNLQTAHVTQYQRNQATQLKNGQKT